MSNLSFVMSPFATSVCKFQIELSKDLNGVSTSRFPVQIYCLSIYDKDINKDDFPNFYRKGTSPLRGGKNGKHSAQ